MKNFKKYSKAMVKKQTKAMKKSPEKTIIIGGAGTALAGYGAIKLLGGAIWKLKYTLKKSVAPPPIPADQQPQPQEA